MAANYLLIAIVLVVFGFGLYKIANHKEQSVSDDVGDDINIVVNSVEDLVDLTSRKLNAFLKQDINELNLTKDEADALKLSRARIRSSLKEAAYGNLRAKAIIKGYIRTVITSVDNKKTGDLYITSDNINDFIPFDDISILSAQDKFLIMLQIFKKEYDKESLPEMFDLFTYNGVQWRNLDNITDDIVNETYDEFIVDHPLSETDKLDYIVQKIFEAFKGFGTADALFETNVDEIDAGVSGVPKDGFELSNKSIRNFSYSYQSIWILLHGKNIHLSCLSFGSQAEIIRVCHNVYKYNAQKVFSRKSGYVISSMADGSRVVVTRPPFSDKYAFYVRKFDSAPSIEPERIIKEDGKEIPITLVKWLIRGQRNIAITGSQGTGKTTLLKSFCSFIENLNIRTQELAFEMYLSFAYPDKNISSFQETESVSAQEGLNVQKKTNGAVNIVGEVAEAEQASHIIQTAMVASLFAMFTHHAKTTRDLVEAIALNLLQLGLYKEKRDAVETSAKVLNIDIHLNNVKGDRHIERISEVIPVHEDLYPSEITGEQLTQQTLMGDMREFFKRMTDRNMFEVRELVRYIDGAFVLVNLPSDDMMAEMRSKFSAQDEAEFDADLEMIKEVSDRILKEKGYVNENGVLKKIA